MESGKPAPGVSLRGILIGALGCLLVGWWPAYAEMIIHASPLSNDYCAPISIFVFFLVAAGLNGLLSWLRPAWRLTKADLAAVFVMVLAAAAIPTRGFVSMIGPVVTGSQYYATVENRWGDLVVPHTTTRTWIVPQGAEVIKRYYEGTQGAPIPWQAWVRPVISWFSLCLAVSLVMISLAVILRKQWVERERIVFPLMQLPMELAKSGDPGSAAPVWYSWPLWIGFSFPLLLYTYQGLAYYFPQYLTSFNLTSHFPIFGGHAGIRIRLSLISISLLYFCRSDMLLGLSVFPLALTIAKGWMRSNGAYPQVPKLGIWSYDAVEAFFGAGILLVFVIRIVYFARRHLIHVFRTALGIGRREDDAHEVMSYRSALACLVLSGGFFVFWLMGAGMSWWEAVLYIVLAFTIFLALARVIAEAGLPTALPPMVAGDFLVGLIGSRALSPANLVGLGFTYPYHGEMRCFLLSHCANALKFSHETIVGSKRRLLWGLLLAVTLAFLVSMSLMIYFPYRDGALNLDRWTFKNTAEYSWLDASRRMTESRGPVWEGFPLMAYGAGLMTVLLVCAHFVPYWPIHPGALVVSFHWAGQVLWSSAVAAFTIKYFILKYGGAGVFTGSRPFFYGIILGEVVTAALWVIIDGLSGKTGNLLTAFF